MQEGDEQREGQHADGGAHGHEGVGNVPATREIVRDHAEGQAVQHVDRDACAKETNYQYACQKIIFSRKINRKTSYSWLYLGNAKK